MGWLLRLFRSDFFDAFMAVTYLYRYRDSGGVHDYLCNQLYTLTDADLEAFIPQLCNILVHHARNSPGLERFVMDKCADSMHIALQVFWFLQAAVEDAARRPDKETEARVRHLRTRCETTAVNGSKHVMLAAAATRISAATLVAFEPPFSSTQRCVPDKILFPSNSAVDLSSERCALRNERLLAEPTDDHAPSIVHGVEERDFVLSRKTASDNSTYEKLGDADEARRAQFAPSSDGAQIDDFRNALRNATIGDADDIDEFVDAKDEHIPVDDAQGNAHNNAVTSERPATTELAPSMSVAEVAKNASEASTGESGQIPDAESTETGEHSQKPEPQPEQPAVLEKADAHEPRRNDPTSRTRDPDLATDFDPLALLTMKKERFDYFNDSISIARQFVRLSLTTRDLPNEQRQAHLTKGLRAINDMLLRRMKGEPGEPLVDAPPAPIAADVAKLGRNAMLRSVHLPLTRASSQALRILRVHAEEVVILTSRTRAPYMVNIEVLPTQMACSDKLLFCEHRVERPEEEAEEGKVRAESGVEKEVAKNSHESDAKSEKRARRGRRRLSEMTPSERQRANVRKMVYGDAYSPQPDEFCEAEEEALAAKVDPNSAEYRARQAVILGVYGELWSWKEDRILGKSPFKDISGSKLMPFIVKAGDDLRQEQLAIQLISQFDKIFKEEGVEVYLKPFTVMSVSSEAGFVEVIKDSVSVHSLKKRTPNFVSLLDYFTRAYGPIGSNSFRAAQRRFIRSMAGYSLVTYFLQIKDRHNGNIMLDAEGRIIHIDFGFMLANSPGAIKFENVPFKLTEEYLQVICGMSNVQDLEKTSKSDGYRYFQEQFVLGLLAARKHYEKVATLVEIMVRGTTMPCMIGGTAIMEALHSRFSVGMPEEQSISFALNLIEESRLSWRSAGYDRFQAYSNGYQ